jgi:glycosyltransferase involved in cell wall biosynthesis
MTSQQGSHVFHLITRLLKGGAERLVTDAVVGLNNYDFTVGYGAFYDQEQVDLLNQHNIETKQFPLIRHYNPVTALPAIASVANYSRRNDFDIVHTHSTEAGIIGRFAAAVAGIPHIVHTVHGIPFTGDRNAVLNRFILACERAAAKYTDRIAVNADIIADDYLARGIGSPEQYTTIYIGIKRKKFRNVKPASDLPGNRPRIVMIGRLAEGKGFNVMLDAVESICDGNFSVCLVGDGPLYESLESEIDNRELSDSVFLTGFRDDIPRVLAASDIFALPSFREGTPRVILEAMASGLPVVATDIAGIPEQVEDGESGYLIPTGTPSTLADRLDELLSNSDLRKLMGEKGHERTERFSVETMLDDFDNLYQELLHKTNKPSDSQ